MSTADADTPTTTSQHEDNLKVLEQRIVYQKKNNEVLVAQIDLFQRIFMYLTFLFVMVILIANFPNYLDKPLAFYIQFALLLFIITNIVNQNILVLQVYVLNLTVYLISRVYGIVYQPYVVYGALM